MIGESVCGGEAGAQETRTLSFFACSLLRLGLTQGAVGKYKPGDRTLFEYSIPQPHSRESAFLFIGGFYGAESKNSEKRFYFLDT